MGASASANPVAPGAKPLANHICPGCFALLVRKIGAGGDASGWSKDVFKGVCIHHDCAIRNYDGLWRATPENIHEINGVIQAFVVPSAGTDTHILIKGHCTDCGSPTGDGPKLCKTCLGKYYERATYWTDDAVIPAAADPTNKPYERYPASIEYVITSRKSLLVYAAAQNVDKFHPEFPASIVDYCCLAPPSPEHGTALTFQEVLADIANFVHNHKTGAQPGTNLTDAEAAHMAKDVLPIFEPVLVDAGRAILASKDDIAVRVTAFGNLADSISAAGGLSTGAAWKSIVKELLVTINGS